MMDDDGGVLDDGGVGLVLVRGGHGLNNRHRYRRWAAGDESCKCPSKVVGRGQGGGGGGGRGA